MVDIGTISVVSSGLVALGTLAANFIGGERQRRQEADLDFETRVWERKSDALFNIIEDCRRLIDSDDPIDDQNRLTYALSLSKLLDRLHNNLSTVEAFASTECRHELRDLIKALRDGGVKHDVGDNHSRYVSEGLKVSVLDDHARWVRYQTRRKDAESVALKGFAPDLDDLRRRGTRLLEAARESVRRSKD